jgi:hypothetical protein
MGQASDETRSDLAPGQCVTHNVVQCSYVVHTGPYYLRHERVVMYGCETWSVTKWDTESELYKAPIW